MPYDHPLPSSLKKQGWRVKIRDRERLEEPHVTIIRRTTCWRFGLRCRGFLDDAPDPAAIPSEVMDAIESGCNRLIAEWDRRYPENPVIDAGENDDRNP